MESTLNKDIIQKIVDCSSNIKGMNQQVLGRMLFESCNVYDNFVRYEVEDDKVVSFMLANIQWFDGQNVCFIQACSSIKNGVVQDMLDECIAWSKILGVKKIVFMTKRNPMAWERKYKFNKTYSVMERLL